VKIHESRITQVSPGQQEAADVAAEDHAVIGAAEVVDGEHDRKG